MRVGPQADGMNTNIYFELVDTHVMFSHRCHQGAENADIVDIVDNQQFRTTSVDPLTVEPAVRCERCGLVGWIWEGEWVPGATRPEG